MIQMLLYLVFILSPFILMGIMGVNWAWKVALTLLGTMALLAMGAITGLIIAAISEPVSYWKAYSMPDLWTSIYIKNVESGENFYKLLVIPYILAADFIRLYFDFSIKMGSLKIWIPEFITFILIVKWIRSIWFPAFRGNY